MNETQSERLINELKRLNETLNTIVNDPSKRKSSKMTKAFYILGYPLAFETYEEAAHYREKFIFTGQIVEYLSPEMTRQFLVSLNKDTPT